MPELSRFYGIVVKMFFRTREHNPPHIHAIYGDYVGVFEIEGGGMLYGDLPQKAQGLVQEWIFANRERLLKIWNTQEFEKCPPLE